MGCRNDYLEPTGMEKGLKRAAELAIFVGTELGVVVPSDIMAQSGSIYAADVGQVQWLCQALKDMSPADRERIVYDGHNKVSRDLADWAEEHAAADTARMAEEAREAALAKLTPADRRALGL